MDTSHDGGPRTATANGDAAAPLQPAAERRLELENEFGHVIVALDLGANGPRLRIEDLRNGRTIHLDPLELASLTWLTHDRLGPFLDPSQTGWRSDEGAFE